MQFWESDSHQRAFAILNGVIPYGGTLTKMPHENL